MQHEKFAQHFTPPAVAEFTWKLSLAILGCEPVGRVIDPAAGQGVFLDVGLSNGWLEPGGAYGIELDSRLKPIGMAEESSVFRTGDGLCGTFPGVRAGSFDLVIGNPPFGTVARVLPPEALQRLERLGGSRFSIGSKPGASQRRPVSKLRLEHLFLERALELVREGGVIALILPEGFLANVRHQSVRNWVLERADLQAVVGLPDRTFRRPGLSALTSVVAVRKRFAGGNADSGRPHVFMAGRDAAIPMNKGRSQQGEEISRLTHAVVMQLARKGTDAAAKDVLHVPVGELVGKRWDVTYWRGVMSNTLQSVSRFPEAALGDFIDHLTYGPIVTGEPPPEHVAAGIPVIRQTDFLETGLCLSQVLRVDPGSRHNPIRSKVRTGDLLLPRSGVGSLGRNRMAVYMNARAANVGCFVDLIRLRELNPFYVWMLLRSEPGWGQIRTLINGVGTPNINFTEIRSLRIPLIPVMEQSIIEERYRATVWPFHRQGAGRSALRARAWRNFQRIRSDLEGYLAGSSKTLSD
jgi:type I restriction enzyme M protein